MEVDATTREQRLSGTFRTVPPPRRKNVATAVNDGAQKTTTTTTRDKRSKVVVRNLPSTMSKEQFLDCMEKELECLFGRDFSYFDFIHGKTKEKEHVEALSEKENGEGKKTSDEKKETSKTNETSKKKKPKKVNTNATAFIDLCVSTKETERNALIAKFVKAFDGAMFQVKGEMSRAKVEFALNQRVPFGAQQKKREDGVGESAGVLMQTMKSNAASSAIFNDADFLSFKKTFDENGGRHVAGRSSLRTDPVQPRDEVGKDNVKIPALVDFVMKKRHSEQAILEKERKEEERKRLAKVAKKKKKKNNAAAAGGGGGNVSTAISNKTSSILKRSGTVRGGPSGNAQPHDEKKRTKTKKKSSTTTLTAIATTIPAPKPKSGGRKDKKPGTTTKDASAATSAKKLSKFPVPKPKPK